MEHTLRFFPAATVLVDEAELDDYLTILPRTQLETHPGLVMPFIRNFAIENLTPKDEVLVLADDDITALRSVVGWLTRSFDDPEVALAVVEQAAQCAIDAEIGLFGFNQSPNPLYFRPTRPFRLERWVGSLIGLVPGTGSATTSSSASTMTSTSRSSRLMKHRIVWCDDRWSFTPARLNNKGGASFMRTDDRDSRELAQLQDKWGSYVTFTTKAKWGRHEHATAMMTGLRVKRRA